MLLRVKPHLAQRAVELLPGLSGELVDAAEIFEDPGWLMARLPGDSVWPRPGAPGFGWRPDVFERPDRRVEIVSCGYARSKYLAFHAFGLVVTDASSVRSLREFKTLLERMTPAEPGNMFDEWRNRCGVVLPDDLAQVLFDLDTTALGIPEVGIHENVVYPDDLSPAFASLSYFCRMLVQHEATSCQASAYIVRLLSALSINVNGKPGLLDIVYWHGDGNPRYSIPEWYP